MISEGRVLIDGGTVNPLPLNRVAPNDGDLLIAVNVSAPSEFEIDNLRKQAEAIHKTKASILERIITSSPSVESNYFTLLSKTYSLMIQQNAELSIKLTTPDILVNMPMNRFGGFDYERAQQIIKFGKMRMKEALNDYMRLSRELSFSTEKNIN